MIKIGQIVDFSIKNHPQACCCWICFDFFGCDLFQSTCIITTDIFTLYKFHVYFVVIVQYMTNCFSSLLSFWQVWLIPYESLDSRETPNVLVSSAAKSICPMGTISWIRWVWEKWPCPWPLVWWNSNQWRNTLQKMFQQQAMSTSSWTRQVSSSKHQSFLLANRGHIFWIEGHILYWVSQKAHYSGQFVLI